MKRPVSLILMLYLSVCTILAQNKQQISISYGVINNSIFWTDEIIGAGGFDNGSSQRIGVLWNKSIIKNLWISTGFKYFEVTNQFSNASLGPEYDIHKSQTLGMIQLPVGMKLDILKYFFIRPAVSLNCQVMTGTNHISHDLSGIGAELALGAQIVIKDKLSLAIDTEPGITNLISLANENYKQRMALDTYSFSVGYRF